MTRREWMIQQQQAQHDARIATGIPMSSTPEYQYIAPSACHYKLRTSYMHHLAKVTHPHPTEQADTAPYNVAQRVTRSGLTHVQRDVVRWIRSNAVKLTVHEVRAARLEREAIDPEREAERINALAMNGWKGIIPATEVRVSERGASGIKGVRGTAGRVTQRDAVDLGWLQDSFLLKGLATVGVATHPLATGEQYHAALAECRVRTSRCAVRVYLPNGTSSVKPVSDYVNLRNERKQTRRANRPAIESQAEQDARIAAGIGSIHSGANH